MVFHFYIKGATSSPLEGALMFLQSSPLAKSVIVPAELTFLQLASRVHTPVLPQNTTSIGSDTESTHRSYRKASPEFPKHSPISLKTRMNACLAASLNCFNGLQGFTYQ